MKLVYVLISDETDYYCEQALVSIYSARQNNPDSKIELLVDQATDLSLKGSRGAIRDSVDEIKVIDVDETFDKMLRSRFIKTSLTRYVEDDFIFLDVDTIILKPFPDFSALKIDNIGAVRHAHEMAPKYLRSLREYFQKTGKSSWNPEKYYNSGVLFVKNTPVSQKFFMDWHSIWDKDRREHGIKIDQPSFSLAEMKNPGAVREINGIYNCQSEARLSKPYFFNTCVFHYFSRKDNKATSPLKRISTFEKIKTDGIDESMKEIIKNPQYHYFLDWHVLSKRESFYHKSLINRVGRKIYFLFHPKQARINK